jgi:hypothetical protein
MSATLRCPARVLGDSDMINARCGLLCRLKSDISRGPRGAPFPDSCAAAISTQSFNHVISDQ